MDKKKTMHLVSVGLVILFLSILVSYLIFNNSNSKETKKVNKGGTVVMNPEKEEEPSTPEEPPKEEEPKVEVPKEEPQPEPPKEEEKPKKERAILNEKYKILKEDKQTVTLNEKDYELYSVYYTDPEKPKEIKKAVYYETKLIANGPLYRIEEENEITPYIKEDINKVKKYSYVFNDVSHHIEYYLIRLFTDYYEYDETDESHPYNNQPYETVIILDKDGNFLFYEQVTYTGPGDYWLEIDNKDELLDRDYYVGECYEKRKMSDGNYACKNRYVLYDGTYDTELITPYAYEFLSDHFFGLTFDTIDSDESDYDHKAYDRIYYIQGGVLKSQLLNTYEGDQYFQAAGED